MSAVVKVRAEDEQGTGAVAECGVEMCSARAGGMTFGVPIMRVLEILGTPVMQPVPLAPSFIGGLVHYRGEVLTAVSLRRLLDMDDYDRASDVLVFEVADGCYGLMVDAVGEVMIVPPESFEASPSMLDDRHKALFAEVCKLGDGLIILLDPDRLDPMRLAE